jgi:hypothetical protein
MDIRTLIKSSDRVELDSDNKPYDFYVHQPRPLTVMGYKTVSLLEVCMLSNKRDNLYVDTDRCENTIVGDKELPLLRRVYLKRSSPNDIYTHPYKVPTRLG